MAELPSVTQLLSTPFNALLYTTIIPFLIIFAIFWGLLTALRVFGKKVNLILALAFSIGAFFTPFFSWIAWYVTNLGGFVALIAFIGLFIFGIINWVVGRGKDIYYDTSRSYKKIENINKEIENLQRKLQSAPDERKMAIVQDIERKEREKRVAYEELSQI